MDTGYESSDMVYIGKHTIFGRVKDGMNVVKRMGLVPTDKNDRYVYVDGVFFLWMP